MRQQSRAYGVALELAALYPEFTIATPTHADENPHYIPAIELRRRDGATISVSHQIPIRDKDKSEISIFVRKIDEAPYGLTPPSGKWNARSKRTDADIALDFKVQYGDQMHSYIEQAMAARRAAIAFYESRAAFAQQLATAGNGKYRPASTQYTNQMPCADNIYCAGVNDKLHWKVEHFNHSNTELHVWVTDEQALAIMRLLTNQS